MTASHFIELASQKVKLNYTVFGEGREVLLAFHGYGQDREAFQTMAQALGKRYRIYSFDLFFHGESYWPFKEKPITKDNIELILTKFLEEQNIGRFSVMGFSMGGKMALTAIERFAPRIDEAYLLAADGIATSFWYTLVTYPKPLRKFFRNMVSRPELFFKSIKFLGQTKIVHKSLIKFSSSQMNTSKKRYRVYNSWINFRKLTFNIRQIARLMNRHEIRTFVFIGNYDRVITVQNMRKLTDRLKNCELHVLNTGHHKLIQGVAKFLEKE